MAPRRLVLRSIVAAAAAALAILHTASPARASSSAQQPRRLTVIALPVDPWQRFAERTLGGAVGLGVYPSAREAGSFLAEIGTGAPAGASGDRGGEPGSLGRALSRAGLRVAVAQGGPDAVIGPLARAFSADGATIPFASGEDLTTADVMIAWVATANDAEAIFPSPRGGGIGRTGPAIVLGVADKTPIWIETCEAGCTPGAFAPGGATGLLDGGIARRPAIVTPYDLAVTALGLLDVKPPAAFSGNVLRAEPDGDALGAVRALAARLIRDESYAPAVAATTVALCIVALFVSLLLRRGGRRELAIRAAQGGASVVPGWILQQFVPTGRADLRALVVAAAVVVGAASAPKEPVRAMARVWVVCTLGFAVIASVAPLHPGGEPGLSIWGNPLDSWRFFGLQNVQAAMIALGVVLWGTLAGLGAAGLVATATAAAMIIGAPTMGANFVGVLTFAFGTSAAALALARRRFGFWHLTVSGVIAVAAFAAALAADAGSPVSHGGKAAREISEGGLSTVVDLVRDRLRLNWELIGDFSGGYAWVVGVLAFGAALALWGIRVERGPVRGRAAILGGGLMAIASLVLEDSGFYSGAVLMATTAAAWLLVVLTSPTVDPSAGDG